MWAKASPPGQTGTTSDVRARPGCSRGRSTAEATAHLEVGHHQKLVQLAQPCCRRSRTRAGPPPKTCRRQRGDVGLSKVAAARRSRHRSLFRHSSSSARDTSIKQRSTSGELRSRSRNCSADNPTPSPRYTAVHLLALTSAAPHPHQVGVRLETSRWASRYRPGRRDRVVMSALSKPRRSGERVRVVVAMVPSSTPRTTGTGDQHGRPGSRVRRSTASWRVLVAHMWSWLSTPHASLGTTAGSPASWRGLGDGGDDRPWCSVLAARKSTTSLRWSGCGGAEIVTVPVTANSGPATRRLGQVRKSSVWTWTSGRWTRPLDVAPAIHRLGHPRQQHRALLVHNWP